MTAQGIMNGAGSAMNAMFSGFPAVGGSVKGMQDTSFEQFMETSKSGNEDTSVTPTKETGVKEASVTGKDVNERAKELFSGDSKVKDAPKTRTEEPVEVSQEEAEAVSALLVQVKQVICETLNITEEELANAMEELGLQDSDLLGREGIQQIFLNLNQAEPTEFLTNEELFSEFGELMQAVEQDDMNLTEFYSPECITYLINRCNSFAEILVVGCLTGMWDAENSTAHLPALVPSSGNRDCIPCVTAPGYNGPLAAEKIAALAELVVFAEHPGLFEESASAE